MITLRQFLSVTAFWTVYFRYCQAAILEADKEAISTRTTGVAIVNLQLINPALLVSYLIMMYISVYPLAISIRRTNVYEEKSLGIYSEENENRSYLGDKLVDFG